MTKVADVLRVAFGYIGVIDANEAVEAEDAATGLGALNLMMFSWRENGIAPDWVDVSSPDDELPAPPRAGDAIRFNLAIRLAILYQVTPAPEVLKQADSTLSCLLGQVALANPDFRIKYDLPAAASQRALLTDEFPQ